MTNVSAIPLEFWQDPQGDVLLLRGEHECSVYFACWSAPAEPADFIGHLSFAGASAVHSYTREFSPYHLAEYHHRSFILQVAESRLLQENIDYQGLHYPKSPRIQMKHFVVMGHDIYHEILAVGFTASTIPAKTIQDPRLLELIRNA